MRELVASKRWFHSIDFGDFASSGRFAKGMPQNSTLYGAFEFLEAMDLSRAAVLDVGTYDGITAFGAKKLGAEKVVAVDNARQETFLIAREALGYTDNDVKHVNATQIRDLVERFGAKSFDCIVCAGVLYHMLYPMQAFVETRKVLKDGGYLILETVFDPHSEDAILTFNGSNKFMNEIYTYFIPSRTALTGMANLVGFRVIAEREMSNQPRITLLLQAVDRDELQRSGDVPEYVREMLAQDLCDNEFRFRHLEALPKELAKVSLKKAPAAVRKIDPRTEAVTFPCHPPRDRPVFGISRLAEAKKS